MIWRGRKRHRRRLVRGDPFLANRGQATPCCGCCDSLSARSFASALRARLPSLTHLAVRAGWLAGWLALLLSAFRCYRVACMCMQAQQRSSGPRRIEAWHGVRAPAGPSQQQPPVATVVVVSSHGPLGMPRLHVPGRIHVVDLHWGGGGGRGVSPERGRAVASKRFGHRLCMWSHAGVSTLACLARSSPVSALLFFVSSFTSPFVVLGSFHTSTFPFLSPLSQAKIPPLSPVLLHAGTLALCPNIRYLGRQREHLLPISKELQLSQ
jgi:hypothetical protein